MPLVSVIIPTFNRGHVLGEALASVLDQDHTDLDVIVIDDGSSDDTRAVVATIADADPRVHYHYQQNAGAAPARNAGIDLATGDSIAFLDSDDSWERWHLRLQLAALARNPEAGLTWTNVDAVNAEGEVVSAGHLIKLLSAYRYFSLDEMFTSSSPLSELDVEIPAKYRDNRLYVGDVFSPMVMGNLVLTSSVVMRRERLERVGRFDEALVTGEDYEFFLRACREGPVAFADLPDVRYRVGTSDRLSGPAMSLPIARAYLDVLETTLSRDAGRITLSKPLIREARVYAHRWVGETELASGSSREALRQLASAVRLAPLRPWLYVLLVLALLPKSALQRLIRWRRRLRGA